MGPGLKAPTAKNSTASQRWMLPQGFLPCEECTSDAGARNSVRGMLRMESKFRRRKLRWKSSPKVGR